MLIYFSVRWTNDAVVLRHAGVYEKKLLGGGRNEADKPAGGFSIMTRNGDRREPHDKATRIH